MNDIDRLDQLPEVDRPSTPEEMNTMNQYFGQPSEEQKERSPGGSPGESGGSGSSGSKLALVKNIALIGGAFLAIVNPISQSILSNLPFVSDNRWTALVLQTVLFIVAVFLILYMNK